MKRLSVAVRRLAGPAAVFAATGVLLAGCHSSSGNGGSNGSGTPGPSSTSSSSGSGGTSFPAIFPVAVGNTWVYDDTLGSSHGTTTNVITAVAPAANGHRVTITTHSDIPGLPKTATKLSYNFNSDGSIGVPLAQVGNGSVVVKSGSIVWPSQAELDSGKTNTSTLVMQVTTAGHSITTTGRLTVKGGGTQSVTVPAGTYQATVVDETITEHIEGISISISIRTWLAPDVGPVKSVVSTNSAGANQVLSTEVLKSFTKG